MNVVYYLDPTYNYELGYLTVMDKALSHVIKQGRISVYAPSCKNRTKIIKKQDLVIIENITFTQNTEIKNILQKNFHQCKGKNIKELYPEYFI